MSNQPLRINLVPTPQFTLKVVNQSSLDKEQFQFVVGNNSSSLFGSGSATPVFPNPNLLDETDTTYFYFGWENVNGGWLIQRQARETSVSMATDFQINPSYSLLSNVWPNRHILAYT